MIGQALLFSTAVAAGIAFSEATEAASDNSACPAFVAGEWYNPDPELHDLSSIELEVSCEYQSPYIKARVKTSCRPRDCSWGWSDGYLHHSGLILLEYGGIFKSQRLNVRPGQNRLEVFMKTTVHGNESKNLQRNFILLRD
ncbi:hypothetical protein [Pseudovibrio exalbescens]|uniref:Uncharacterized protein n=1 Tax=Pseudovibrio exalbescens TaxID=197461 RepID=A0A1U7JI40_9HYPH|nr:hypothetical protein [Pseudovibrio exalbescens]OKL44399.1 hypothetical protein A3843_08395 [Pseudovibrio exalbescens]